jgi:hypothetical protein
VVLDSLVIAGNQDKLNLETSQLRILNGEQFLLDNFYFEMFGSFVNLLDMKKMDFLLNLKAENIHIPSEFVDPNNYATVNVLVQGNLNEIALNTRITSDILQVSLPMSDTLAINEEIRGLEVSIRTDNVLSKPLDISLTIDKVLDTRFRAIGRVDIHDMSGTFGLYADDLRFVMPQNKVAVAAVPIPEPPVDRPRGQRRGEGGGEGSGESRRRPPVEIAPSVIEQKPDFVKFTLVSEIEFRLSKDNVLYAITENVIKNIEAHFDGNNLVGEHITINTTSNVDLDDPMPLDTQVEVKFGFYNNSISGVVAVDLVDFDAKLNIIVNRFSIDNVNPTFPNLSINSNIAVHHNADEIKAIMNVVAGDVLIRDYYLIGDILFAYEKTEDIIDFQVKIYDSYVNYTPFFATITAGGDKTFIKSDVFTINDLMFGDFYVEIPPEIGMLLSDPFAMEANPESRGQEMGIPNLKFSLIGDNIDIETISYYFMNHSMARFMTGSVDLSVRFDNIDNPTNPIFADVKVNDFHFQPLHPVSLHINASGDLDNIQIGRIVASVDTLNILNAHASILDFGQSIKMHALFSADIFDIQEMDEFGGVVNATIDFEQKGKSSTANIKIVAESIYFNEQPVASLHFDATQFDDRLVINHGEVLLGPQYRIPSPPRRRSRNTPPQPFTRIPPLMGINVSGLLNYNFITDTIFPITDSVYVSISGDPVKLAQSFTDMIEHGHCSFYFDTYIIIDEDGLQVPKGRLEIVNTHVRIADQLFPLDRVDVLATIEDNNFTFQSFRARFGRGNIHLRNQIVGNDDDMMIGNLNLGKFFIRTNNDGIQVHAPGFMTKGTTASVIIRGQNNEREATIIGPIDDMTIVAEVEVFNSNIIFPENADNLVRMLIFNQSDLRAAFATEDAAPMPELPLKLDLMIALSRNNRYVTSPMNLLFEENGRAHIRYNGKDFIVVEAAVGVESGTIDLLGTLLTVDFAEVLLSHFEEVPNINAHFFKKVADGTTISLNIFTDASLGAELMDRLKFELSSDNPDDTILDIFSKLRYGKSMAHADGNMGSEELFNLVGTVGGAVLLDPFLAPIERRFRRILKLDNITISPGLIQNMLNNQIWNDFGSGDDLNSNLFLNNLSINMGRYVHRDFFVEYGLLFQENNEIDTKSDMFLYHSLGLRYDLPFRFQVRYSYEINPRNELNAHEIFLMRSFRF